MALQRALSRPFSWHKLKNDISKIKWILFLNSFDYRHIPGLGWKITLWVLLSKSQNYSRFYWNKVKEAQTQWKVFFHPEKMFCFWLNTDYCSCGELRNTMEPSHQYWINSLSNLRTISPKMSILHSFLSMHRQFSKKNIRRLQKDTWKRNYIMGPMKRKILQLLLTKLYNFLSWKKCLHFPLPGTLPYLSVPNSLSLQLSSDSNRLRRL